MTEVAPLVARRFCVLLTSVLRRCVAVGLFGLCLLSKPAWADYAGDDMIRAAFENCVPKVESAAVVGVNKYWRFDALKIDESEHRNLSANDRIWIGDTDSWYLRQPEPLYWSLQCEVISYSFVVEDMAVNWNAYLANNEDGFELMKLATVNQDEWGVRACGRAVRDVETGTTEVIFCAVKDVGETPWATASVRWIWSDSDAFRASFCANWPEECV